MLAVNVHKLLFILDFWALHGGSVQVHSSLQKNSLISQWFKFDCGEVIKQT